MSTSDEAARFLEVSETAKNVATVAALALIQSEGDPTQARHRLDEQRHAQRDDLLGHERAFVPDVVTLAEQAIADAEQIMESP